MPINESCTPLHNSRDMVLLLAPTSSRNQPPFLVAFDAKGACLRGDSTSSSATAVLQCVGQFVRSLVLSRCRATRRRESGHGPARWSVDSVGNPGASQGRAGADGVANRKALSSVSVAVSAASPCRPPQPRWRRLQSHCSFCHLVQNWCTKSEGREKVAGFFSKSWRQLRLKVALSLIHI